MPVTIEADIKNTFHDDTSLVQRRRRDLPGTDKADEVVMLGAHFDSWHAGTGATDNAAGSAVMMEAMRILKQSGVQAAPHGPHRAVGRRGAGAARLARLRHAALRRPRDDGAEAGARASSSGYFNVDNGTGAIRGIYLQGNEAVAPIFQAWMKPFHNLGMNDAHDPRHRRHRPPGVRRRRPARLPVHSGSGRVQHAHAPLEHGHLRAHPGGGHAEERGDRRLVRLPGRQSRRDCCRASRCRAPPPAGAGRSSIDTVPMREC